MYYDVLGMDYILQVFGKNTLSQCDMKWFKLFQWVGQLRLEQLIAIDLFFKAVSNYFKRANSIALVNSLGMSSMQAGKASIDSSCEQEQ